MYEAKAIIEDFRMQAMGGMAGSWHLWETAINPSLLTNCGSWVGIGKLTYSSLNELHELARLRHPCLEVVTLPIVRARGSR